MKIKSIVVPIDFSEHAIAALREAVGIAARNQAEIALLHAVEPLPHPTRRMLKSHVVTQVEQDVRKRCEADLRELGEREIGERARWVAVVRDGESDEAIVRLADERNADLIVISTHGHTGLKRLLLGSTTEKVVRLAGCSVLVVRSQIGDEI